MKKVGVLILTSAAGTAIGYPIFLLVSLVLLVIYGDDGQGGHPTEALKSFRFYGTFGITTLIGFGMGFFILKEGRK